ncbi:MAG: putative 4-hydroxybenzoate polyprenyltransferase [Fibrobacterales bacterium]
MAKLLQYLELVKFSHTIFALPFALGTFVIATEGVLDPWLLIWVLVCMVTARNAAMAFNRLIDARFDAKNPRTAERHIPAGLISPIQATVFIVLNCIVFMVSAGMLNKMALMFSAPLLVFLLSYSFWKRFSWLCHIFLGLAIGLSPLGVWIGVRGEIALFPIILGLILTFWISGFDIIYATQDEEADTTLGLHSAVTFFGAQGALIFAKFLHLVMFSLMMYLYFLRLPNVYWGVTCGVTGFILLYLHVGKAGRSLDSLNSAFFKANAAISVLIMGALMVSTYI